MKNRPLCSAALLGLLTTACLLPPLPAARAQTTTPTTWAQSYGVGDYDGSGQPSTSFFNSSGYDLATGIAPMPDGGVVIAGRLNLPEANGNLSQAGFRNGIATLVRYAANGTILWQQALRQSNDIPPPGAYQGQPLVATNTIYQVLTDAQGNIFACLVQAPNSASSTPAYIPTVAKFNADGALLWKNGFLGDKFTDSRTPPTVSAAGTDATLGVSFSLTPDGGVIFGSGEHPNDGSNAAFSVAFYAKFNAADGSLDKVRHRPFKNAGQYDIAFATAQSADLKRILTSIRNTGTVLLTDADSGALIAERTFSTDGGPTDVIVRALPISGGGFILLGQDSYQNAQGLTVHRVDANLVPVWEKVYRNFGPGANLTTTSDGGYLLTGVVGAGSNNADALLLKIDGSGNPVFARRIGGPKNEGDDADVPAPSAVQTTDGGYALTVSSFSYATGTAGHPDFWTVKLDANGHLPNFAGTQTDIPLSTFGVHDNTIPSVVTSSYVSALPNGYTGDAAVGDYGVVLENLATNTGINKPTVMIQAAPATGPVHPAFFNGETALSNGVYYLQLPNGSPFGYYSYLSDPRYIFHFDLGYEYLFDANDGKGGVYLYDFKSGSFFYTSPSFPFPYLYDFSLKALLYYYPDTKNAGHYTTGPRYFFNFATGQIISK